MNFMTFSEFEAKLREIDTLSAQLCDKVSELVDELDTNSTDSIDDVLIDYFVEDLKFILPCGQGRHMNVNDLINSYREMFDENE